MKATILDEREDGLNKCYLCKISLEEYIKGLDATYQDYDIQREIVTNVYLDTLVETVLARRHIPPIVLVADKKQLAQEDRVLEVPHFKILDGLQRTFRLQAIRNTVDFWLDSVKNHQDPLTWSKFKFSRTFSQQLHEFDSNTDVLRAVAKLHSNEGEVGLINAFTLNYQWFEVWTGLSASDEVRKMLTLNAGHKPVKTRHQLELLFLNILPALREGEGSHFMLVREKETSATSFSKERDSGHFHFAHIITALLSLYEAKPVTTSTSLIQGIQEDERGIEKYEEFTTPSFLRKVVSFLVKLDRQLKEQYSSDGILWMGREVTLAGLFGAIGAIAEKTETARLAVMDRFLKLTTEHQNLLALDTFEDARNGVKLSKVNIGNVNRTAIFSAVKEVLTDPNHTNVDWQKHFRTEDK